MGDKCARLSQSGARALRRDPADGPCHKIRISNLHCVHSWRSGKLECCICEGTTPALDVLALKAEGLIV